MLKLTLLVSLLATPILVSAEEPKMRYETGNAGEPELTYLGPGELAIILSWGPPPGNDTKLFVPGSGGMLERTTIAEPARVRWTSAGEMIVEHFMRPFRPGSGKRILRVSHAGEPIAVLTDRSGLAHAAPAPAGQRAAFYRYTEHGLAGIEIRDIASDFDLVLFQPIKSAAADLVWSPDGTRLATSLSTLSPTDRGILDPRLATAPAATLAFERINDAVEEGPEPRGANTLFWTERGLYAYNDRGLLCCDVRHGSGCRVVYAPGAARMITGGAATGDLALLTVRDVSRDPLDVRASELHAVHLEDGKGSLILKLPDGVYVDDFDLKAGSGPEAKTD